MHTGFEALESWAQKYSQFKSVLCMVTKYRWRIFAWYRSFTMRVASKISLDSYPTLLAIDRHMQTLPAVMKANPDHQPDAV